ncbi:ABC transporter permease subunit [Bacillus sp. AK031]
MFRSLLRKPKFVISCSFLILLLAASFLYEPFFAGHVENIDFFEKNGEMLGPPFSPAEVPPFGTNRLGTPLWSYVIQGAKYTILAGALVSVIQVLAALVVSVFLITFIKRAISWIEGLVESMIYIPLAVVAIMLLRPLDIILEAEEHFLKYLFIQLFLIALIGIPPLIVLLSKELKKALKEEFVYGARTLGARGWHLYKNHIFKNLLPRLVLLFVQQNVKVLILFAHLSFFSLFLGGSFEEEIMVGEVRSFSLSNEWAGNIGKAYFELMLSPWLVFVPLVSLSLTVLAYNFISSSIQEISLLSDNPARKKKKKFKDRDGHASKMKQKITKEKFELYNNVKNTPM